MSLKVWLPLCGNLKQQGTSNIVVNNNGATINTNGKIGNCYYFNASSYLYENTYNWSNFNTSQFSFCCWYKQPSPVASGNSQIICIGTSSGWNNIRIGLLRRTSNGYPMFSVSDGTNAVQYNCTATTFTLDTWNHITCTYDNGIIKIYLNGILNKTYTTTITPVLNTSQHLGIGAASNGAEKLTGYLNDVRIYDHCLSAAEVHEISQGLVLHCKLNNALGNGNNNLIHNTAWGGTTTPPTKWSNWGSPTTREIVTVNNKKWLHLVTTTTAFQGYSQNWVNRQTTNEITAGTKVTASVVAYGTANSSFYVIGFHWCDESGSIIGQSWPTYNITTTPTRFYSTFTIPNNCVKFNVMVGDGSSTAHELWISNVKLEIGEKVTDWMAAPEDFNGNNQVTDSSGYSHHGEIINTITFDSNNARYSSCAHFSATNQKIKISNFPTSGFGNSYTFAWWAKISSVTPMHWGFGDGIRLNGMYTGRLWNTGDSSNNPLYIPGTTTQVTAPSVNTWHHWVMTGNGTKCYVYQDGILWGEAKTYKSISGTIIYINGWNANTDYSSNNYSINDFRVYCTALSAEDILALYHTSAKVDNKQNLHSFEFIEDQSKISITKHGQTKCDELEETTNTKFRKDKIIETAELIEF